MTQLEDEELVEVVQCIMPLPKSKALAGLFRAYRNLGKDLRESKETINKLEKRLLFVELYPKISRMFPQLRKVAMMTDLLLKEVNDEKIKQLRDEKYIKKTVGDILIITGIDMDITANKKI